MVETFTRQTSRDTCLYVQEGMPNVQRALCTSGEQDPYIWTRFLMDPARGLSNESPPKKEKESPLHKIHEGLNESPLKHNINIQKNKKYTDFGLKGVPPATKIMIFRIFA